MSKPIFVTQQNTCQEESLRSQGRFLEKLKLELIPKVPKSTVGKQAENGAGRWEEHFRQRK